ncbi:hypothetical protein CIW83_18240 [Tissierella sp. P1]|uniref:hypothetical protein n=1 Tax=Tissierella sp. P1 TaxID=1280483 RepID=UPI000BA11B28|nr:hypothetical protein [Tissierella sp. P1]OZV10761.1 hypothetical protein CIW83_18240 [Tissierella sp. P1]
MSKIDERFIVDLKGKQFVTYEGLLDLAHQKGLLSMFVEIIQIPSKENDMTAICKATAKTENGIFQDIGDAGPNSTNSMIKPHIIRMASTRAKARALRDLTNVGMTAIEELGEDEKTQPTEPIQPKGNLSDKQIKRLYAIAKSVDMDAETVKDHIRRRFNKDVKELTKEEYDTICDGYENLKE